MTQSSPNPPGFTPFSDTPSEQEGALITPFYLGAEHLAASLADVKTVSELDKGSSGITFLRYGDGYYGVPFCESPGDGVNCFPVGPGPNDDPSTFSCVCLGPKEPKELLGPVASEDVARLQTIIRQRCQVSRYPSGNLYCKREGCLGDCQLVQTNPEAEMVVSAPNRPATSSFRPVQVACICV